MRFYLRRQSVFITVLYKCITLFQGLQGPKGAKGDMVCRL